MHRFPEKLRFEMFFIHTKTKPAFSSSPGLENVFKKLCFRDGLVWTVGLTVEIKMRSQISPAKGERGLKIVAVAASRNPFHNDHCFLI